MPLDVDIVARRGSFVVQTAFHVGDGETMALVGPNGAGKSTVIDAIAGLLPVERGTIRIDGEPIEQRPPEHRAVGVAFQDGLLFPHLSVLDNVAFPIRARGGGKGRSRERAGQLLGRLSPTVRDHARPASLSGGERQRVALARALASEPRVLLLDEPLSAADISARADLRALLRKIAEEFQGACVLVAHDPVDALTLADRVAIIEGGWIVQSGTPDEVQRSPATPYAADLVGVNLFQGRLSRDADGGRVVTMSGDVVVEWPRALRDPVDDVIATVRPSHVSIHLTKPDGSPRNILEGPIVEIARHGDRARVHVGSSPAVIADVTLASVVHLGLAPGASVFASFKATDVRLIVPGAGAGTLDA